MPDDLAIYDELKSNLSTEHIRQLVGFTDAGQFLDNINRFSWTGSSEIEEILLIARQNENLSAKLAAIKYLRELLHDVLETSGLLVRATRTMCGPDGETLTLSADLVASSLKHKSKGESDAPQENKPEPPTETIGSHKPPRTDSRNLFPGLSRPTDIAPDA